jgi:hypothetical protein
MWKPLAEHGDGVDGTDVEPGALDEYGLSEKTR